MSLKRRLSRLEQDGRLDFCPFASVIIDVNGMVRNKPMLNGGEPLTAEAFDALRKEHEEDCPVCQRMIARGEIRGVDFRPYDPQ